MKYNIFNSIATWSLKKRINRINSFINEPVKTQKNVLKSLLKKAKDTKWGKKYKYDFIKNYNDFKSSSPIVKYENIIEHINNMKEGETDILWPGNISFLQNHQELPTIEVNISL